ncbi:hypothetical protein, partial [Leptospira interrogans]|uniref:hypothetical protein n=1 Tax=Leptospira interrogans TaxID=173 RepID=UPI0009E318BA
GTHTFGKFFLTPNARYVKSVNDFCENTRRLKGDFLRKSCPYFRILLYSENSFCAYFYETGLSENLVFHSSEVF